MLSGRNWALIELTDTECNVKGFSNELGVLNKIPVATVGTLWVNPEDGSTYILVINEVLYFGVMDFHQHRQTTSTSTTNDDGSQDEKGREEVTSLRTYVPTY